jgi:hypothetical protein
VIIFNRTTAGIYWYSTDLIEFRERLKSVPDLLESLISEKRLLQAAVLLMKSLKAISKPDMLEIGALSDLRSYLTTQETVSLHWTCIQMYHMYV